MAVGDAHVFPGFLTPVLTLLFFPKSPTTFLTCFCRGERRKYAGKKSRLNRVSNSQPPGHESDMLTTEPPGRDCHGMTRAVKVALNPNTTNQTTNKILDWSKLNLNEKSKLFLGRIENIIEKGENAGNQHFLLFSQCFQKPSLSGLLKVGIVW